MSSIIMSRCVLPKRTDLRISLGPDEYSRMTLDREKIYNLYVKLGKGSTLVFASGSGEIQEITYTADSGKATLDCSSSNVAYGPGILGACDTHVNCL